MNTPGTPDPPASQDPKTLHPEPPYDTPMQKPPGVEKRLDPQADHGESTYVGSGQLEGRRALITGADSGIGRAVAIAFAREGADVAVGYLSEDEDAEETARWVREAGRRCVLLRGDIGERDGCREVAQKAVAELGGVDILVNNAAYQRSYPSLEAIPDEEFEEAFRVNLFATFRLCKALLPQMKAGGSIINTGSIQSFDPGAELLPYASTKAAIVSFTLSLASHAIEKGVRVNAVAPGPVWTPLIPSTLPEKKVKHFGENTIFGRAAQPAELAPLFVFLASDRASFVAGEVYGATGGRMPM